MSKTAFIDTQFVVALVNKRDQAHAIAEKHADLVAGSRFVVSDVILIEIADTLSKEFRQEAYDIIKSFIASKDIEIVRLSNDLLAEALELYHTHHDKQWGMTDCISFTIMHQLGIRDALTMDHHFEQAGFHALMS